MAGLANDLLQPLQYCFDLYHVVTMLYCQISFFHRISLLVVLPISKKYRQRHYRWYPMVHIEKQRHTTGHMPAFPPPMYVLVEDTIIWMALGCHHTKGIVRQPVARIPSILT
eukprot:scaffold6068_cov65-Attheya_sp.AAC.3